LVRRAVRKRVPFLEVGPFAKAAGGRLQKTPAKGRRRCPAATTRADPENLTSDMFKFVGYAFSDAYPAGRGCEDDE
jgi:hypothetical protein